MLYKTVTTKPHGLLTQPIGERRQTMNDAPKNCVFCPMAQILLFGPYFQRIHFSTTTASTSSIIV